MNEMTNDAGLRPRRPRAPDEGRRRGGPASWRARLSGFGVLGMAFTVVLIALIVYPIYTMVHDAFFTGGGVHLGAIREVIDDPAFRAAAKNTLLLVITSGTAAMLIGTLLAWLNERTDANMGFVSRLAPLVPLLIPPVALAIGWLFVADPLAGFLNYYIRELLGDIGITVTSGPFNITSFGGLAFVYTIALVPFAYVVIAPAFRNMDSSLEEASRMSGAGPLRTVFRISGPAIGPALASAALLVAIIAASLYSIPAIIGTSARIDTVSVYIVDLTSNSAGGLNESVAASVLLVAFIGVLWLIHGAVTRRQRQITIVGRSAGRTVVHLGKWKWVARAVLLLYLVLVSVMPFVALVIVALQPFWQPDIHVSAFTLTGFKDLFTAASSEGRAGFFDSLKLGVIGGTIVMAMAAVMITYAFERRGVVGKIIFGVTKLPAAISPIVIAVGVLLTFAGSPFRLAGSLVILLLAYVVMFMPQASIAAEVARGQVGDELLEAGWVLGASKLRAVGGILWPLMRPGLAYGWAMMFVLIVSDLEAAAILAGPGNPVVGSEFQAIYTSGVFADLAALAVVVCVTVLLVVGLVTGLFARPVKRRDRRLWDVRGIYAARRAEAAVTASASTRTGSGSDG
jgi:iron(III) transport system permease protein